MTDPTIVAAILAANTPLRVANESDTPYFRLEAMIASGQMKREQAFQLLRMTADDAFLFGRDTASSAVLAENAKLTKVAHLAYEALGCVLEGYYIPDDGPPPQLILDAHAALYELLERQLEAKDDGADLPF